jgi:prepilin peptidase CpaA
MLSPQIYTSLLVVFLAIVLGSAVWIDFRSQRVPNILTFSSAAIGIVLQTLAFGMDGVLNAISGLGVGLAVFLPGYLLWGMGAGDVKLAAAIGTVLGPYPAFIAGISTFIAGAVVGLFLLAYRGGGLAFIRRYGLMLRCLLSTGSFAYIPAVPGEAAASRFPYAIAIALGTVCGIWILSVLNSLPTWWRL